MSRILRLLWNESGLPSDDLLRLIATAPERYKVFSIPKRSGGLREIAQPAREVKSLQRLLVEELLAGLPVHETATAYRKGHSIRQNALAHMGSGPILKMDFADFFPSIKSEMWVEYANKHTNLSEEDVEICSNVFFRRAAGERLLKLSIGAPSSPMLSNILMHEFDVDVASEALKREIHYTRYADDLTFSGQRIGMLRDMIQVVEKSLKNEFYRRISINKDKTVFATSSGRRTVTGVVLPNEGGVSLGRERKRQISAKVHHAILGKLSAEELRALAGDLGFAKSVEPDFLARLSIKYGIEEITRIQKVAKKAPPKVVWLRQLR